MDGYCPSDPGAGQARSGTTAHTRSHPPGVLRASASLARAHPRSRHDDSLLHPAGAAWQYRLHTSAASDRSIHHGPGLLPGAAATALAVLQRIVKRVARLLDEVSVNEELFCGHREAKGDILHFHRIPHTYASIRARVRLESGTPFYVSIAT